MEAQPPVLTIAGSDCGGGAGIQQDLKVFTVLNTYGAGVITALTAQNTLGVHGVEPVAPEFVKKQLGAVLTDIRPVAAKTGMLLGSQVIDAVADELKACDYLLELVIDPVMVSKDGSTLLDKEAVSDLKEKLFPHATLVTPNIPEAEALLDVSITTLEEMKSAASSLLALLETKRKCASQARQCAVFLKGGHLENHPPVDVLAFKDKLIEFPSERIDTKNTHGTGCTLSAAITCFLAKGLDIVKACEQGKEFVTLAIKGAFSLGGGIGPVNPLSWLENDLARYPVLMALEDAWRMLVSCPSRPLVPEVQLNIGYALPMARDVNDVAAFPGRIAGIGNGVARISAPAFGASSHVARIILTVMKYNKKMRSAMNMRFDEAYLERARELGLSIAEFSRSREPEEVRLKEGSTLIWGVKEAIRSHGTVPDIIFDTGDVGKEPIIRILGNDPVSVVEKGFRCAGISL